MCSTTFLHSCHSKPVYHHRCSWKYDIDLILAECYDLIQVSNVCVLLLQLNITVLRSMGLLGSVWVSFHTEGQTAVSGLDFEQSSGRLLFSPGQSSRVIPLKIVDDLLAEGPEQFYLNITQVQLLNDR